MARQFVIDASVVAKWFLKDKSEGHLDLADEILTELLTGELDLHAPRIMSYEVCRLLWKACLTKDTENSSRRLQKEAALDCVKTLFRLPLCFAETTAEEGTISVNLGVKYGKNFYDMTYLRLAEELDCRVITADEKLLRSAPTEFPAQRFVLLTAYREDKSKTQHDQQ